MLKNLSLNKKLGFGFASIIIGLIMVGAIALININKIDVSVMDLAGVHIPLLETVSEIDILAVKQELAINVFALHKKEESVEAFHEYSKEVDELIESAEEILRSDEELMERGWFDKFETLKEHHHEFDKLSEHLIEAIHSGEPASHWSHMAEEVEEYSKELNKEITELLHLNEAETNEISHNAEQAADSAKSLILMVGILTVLIGSVLAFVISLSITKPINRIVETLNAGADQTTSAATQVSSSAQRLSQGTTEQASSLEETSSSLDEIASMTKSNSDNASKASQMASEARNSAEKGDKSMQELQTAMSGITESSDKVSKIIKTIEEIAFQTNLLALNAAVEAARAGEHGKGFAVVAEEVRNLAQRSAVAAKDTSELIEESTNNSRGGAEIAKKAGEALIEIMNESKKVADIVVEIASASKEQTEGIGQITSAVSQMDQVTQQNAATSEETAAASEELTAQADSLREMVYDLKQIVEGRGSKRAIQSVSKERKSAPTRSNARKQLEGPKVVNPEEVIPMDDDFDNF
ncbi:methyl-accepting chemotaxis protein [Candidatus Omnitrophota bacterium]